MRFPLALVIASLMPSLAQAAAVPFDLRCTTTSHDVVKGKAVDIRFINFYSVDTKTHRWCEAACESPKPYEEGLKEFVLYNPSLHGNVTGVWLERAPLRLRDGTRHGPVWHYDYEKCRKIKYTGMNVKSDRDDAK